MSNTLRLGLQRGAIILAIALGTTGVIYAQVAGTQIYTFLKQAPSARLAALGGSNVSIYDGDPFFAFQNPAILDSASHGRLSLSFVDYLADINYGTASYAHAVKNVGIFHGGIQYQNYGTFTEADEFGTKLGTFSASDLAIIAGASRSFGKLRLGANLKAVQSSIQRLSAWGLTADFGGLYYHPKLELGVGVSLRNFGFQLNQFLPGGGRASVPFEIQVGVTKRIPHTPMRFSITGTNLQQPSLIYVNPNAPVEYDLAGNVVPKKSVTADNIFRHLIFGVEFLLSKHFHIRLAYNHQRRAELKTINQNFTLGGFSFGLGLRINRFFLDYGYANYHAIGGVHQFSLATEFSRWKKKAKPIPAPETPATP